MLGNCEAWFDFVPFKHENCARSATQKMARVDSFRKYPLGEAYYFLLFIVIIESWILSF